MMNLRSASSHIVLAALLGAAPACSGDDAGALDGTSVVVVHGAWNGAWAWASVKTGLEREGARVITVELPAHGDDTTGVANASLRSYVDAVEAAIDRAPKPVVLIGHSMGGIVVTEAASERAADLDRLIYVTAFVPKAGDSLLSLSMQDAGSALGAALVPHLADGTIGVDDAQLTPVFCADCDSAASAELHANYRDEPLAPFAEPAAVSADWATVPKFYIYAQDDHAISPAFQMQMTAGIDWRATASIATSHSPFLSQPDLLTTQLVDFATR